MKAVYSGLSANIDSTATLATEANQWFGRATVEKLANGNLVLVYLETPAHDDNTVEVVHIRFSDDQGATWSDEDEYIGGAAVSVGLPTGAGTSDAYGPGDTYIFQTPNGDVYLHTWSVDYSTGNMNGCWRTKSTDNGQTWGAWNQITISGITNNDRAFITEQHFILNGDIYMAGREYQDNPDLNYNPCRNFVAKSEDNGDTWELVEYITSFAENTHECAMEYIGNNTILTYMRDTNESKSYKRTSTDLGATWGDLTEVQAALLTIGRNRLYTRAHLKGEVNWWEDTYLIMVGFVLMVPGSGFTRRNAIWLSTDKGTTWSKPYFIDEQVEDSGYGDIFYNSTTGKYVVINYQGTQAAAVLKQYNLHLHGV